MGTTKEFNQNPPSALLLEEQIAYLSIFPQEKTVQARNFIFPKDVNFTYIIKTLG